ncbi:MAG: undecaprenyl/decaprenyl-phosphate alpha-N-acetylglucosaminyl 1-phosphate transferase, partial [Synechococcaceae bacterium WB4_1_0192]|nr:undecaprenyl/decaprenyl-phosphate alpha-N-acetylglucosaminyl 1-phosphate transferase [Synechococcaceae bacterium WB4_1_0192]
MISSRPDLAAVLAFAFAALFTAVIVPLVRRFGLRLGLIDQP